jgi:hypothetical protein
MQKEKEKDKSFCCGFVGAGDSNAVNLGPKKKIVKERKKKNKKKRSNHESPISLYFINKREMSQT